MKNHAAASAVPTAVGEGAPATRRRSQTQRRADAERKLLESAIVLLGAKGVVGMTLSEVGTAAGYSRGLVAHHYGSKEAFLRAVANYVRDRYLRVQEQTGEMEPGLPTILANVNQYLSGAARTFPAINAMLAEAITSGGTLQADMQNFTAMTQKFFANMIREGIKRGQIRADVNPEAQGMLIVGLLRGVSTQYLLKADRVARDVIQKEAVDTIRRALAAPK
jgi:AcrR family transcriptional regulator